MQAAYLGYPVIAHGPGENRIVQTTPECGESLMRIQLTTHIVIDNRPDRSVTCHRCGERKTIYVQKPGSNFKWCIGCFE